MAEIRLSIRAKDFEQAATKIEGAAGKIANALTPIVKHIEAIQIAFNDINTVVAREQVRAFQTSVRSNKKLVLAHVAEMQAAFTALGATIASLPAGALSAINANTGGKGKRSRSRGSSGNAVRDTQADLLAQEEARLGNEIKLASQRILTLQANEAALADQRYKTIAANKQALTSYRELTIAQNAQALATQRLNDLESNSAALALQRSRAIRENREVFKDFLILEKAAAQEISKQASVRVLERQLLRQVSDGFIDASVAAERYRGAIVAGNAAALQSFRERTILQNQAALSAQKLATIDNNAAALQAFRAKSIRDNTSALRDSLIAEKALAGGLQRSVNLRQLERQLLREVAAGNTNAVAALNHYRAAVQQAANSGGVLARTQQLLAKSSVLAFGPLSGLAARVNALSSLYLGFSGTTVAVVAGLIGTAVAFTKAVKAASDYEKALVAVAKTTNSSDLAIQSLGDRLRRLSSEIGVPATELAEIAAVAGQLGIRGEEALTRFSDAIGKITRTSDLAAETAAKAFARILVVTGEPFENVTQLGSAVTALGNSFAASEAEIAQTSLEIAKIGSVVGLTSSDVVALGAAFAQLGVSVQNAGTSSGRVLLAIRQNARAGGQGLAELARITLLTEDAIKQFAETDITKVFIPFLEGLNRLEGEGEAATDILKEFGLSGVREAKSLLPLVTRVNEVSRAFATARKAAASGSATNDEFARRAQSLSAQTEKLGVRLKNIAIVLGNELLPSVTFVTAAFNFLIRDTESIGVRIAAIVKGLGAAAIAFAVLRTAILAAASVFPFIAVTAGPLAIIIGTLVFAYETLGKSALKAASGIDESNKALLEAETRSDNAIKAMREGRDLIRIISESGFQNDSQIKTLTADFYEFSASAARGKDESEALAFTLAQLKKRYGELRSEFKAEINLEEIADAREEIEDLSDDLADVIAQRKALNEGGEVGLFETDSRLKAIEIVEDLNKEEQLLLLSELEVGKAVKDVEEKIRRLTRARNEQINQSTPLVTLLTEIFERMEKEKAAAEQLSEALGALSDINFDTTKIGLTEIEQALADNERAVREAFKAFGDVSPEVLRALESIQEATRLAFQAEFLEDFNQQLRDLKFENALVGMTELNKTVVQGQREIIELAKQAGISGRTLVVVAKLAGDAFKANFQAKVFDGIIQGIRSVIEEAKKLTFTGPNAEREQALAQLEEQFKKGEISADQFSASIEATNRAFDFKGVAEEINILGTLQEEFRKIDTRVDQFGRKFGEGENAINQFGLTLEEEGEAKVAAVQNALNQMIEQGIDPSSKAFQELKDQVDNTKPSLDGINRIVSNLREGFDASEIKVTSPFDPLIKSAQQALAEDGPIAGLRNMIEEIKQKAASIEIDFKIDNALKAAETVKKALENGTTKETTQADGSTPLAGTPTNLEPLKSDAKDATARIKELRQAIKEYETELATGPEFEITKSATETFEFLEAAKSDIAGVNSEYNKLRESFEKANPEIKLNPSPALKTIDEVQEKLRSSIEEEGRGILEISAEGGEPVKTLIGQIAEELDRIEEEKRIKMLVENAERSIEEAGRVKTAVENIKDDIRIEINTDDLLNEMPNLQNFENIFKTLRDGQPIRLTFNESDRETMARVFQEFENFKTSAQQETIINATPSQGLTDTSTAVEDIKTGLAGIRESEAPVVNVTAGEQLQTVSDQTKTIADSLRNLPAETAVNVTAGENLKTVSDQAGALNTALGDIRKSETVVTIDSEDAQQKLNTLATPVNAINLLRDPITVTLDISQLQQQVEQAMKTLEPLTSQIEINVSVVEAIQQIGVLADAMKEAIETQRSVNVDISQGLRAAAELSAALDAAVEKIRIAHVQLKVSGSPTLPFSDYLGPNGYASKTFDGFVADANDNAGVTVPVEMTPQGPKFKTGGASITDPNDVLGAIGRGPIVERGVGNIPRAVRPSAGLEILTPYDPFGTGVAGRNNNLNNAGRFIMPPRGESTSVEAAAEKAAAKVAPQIVERLYSGMENVAGKIDGLRQVTERVAQGVNDTANNTADTADAANRTAAGLEGDKFTSNTLKKQTKLVRARTGRRTAGAEIIGG